jgi:cytidyltransferase-like protein
MTSLTQPAQKILAESAVLEQLVRPRERRLVFTNGVFDILHRGHVEYLYAARALGDELIVALNTDVTFFGDDTPLRLLTALLPDVLVKGGDYTPDTIVGRTEVEAAGGRVVVIPFVEGRSTTNIVNKIRGS